MITLGNARELLLIEAVGDVVKLLDRVETLTCKLDAASAEAQHASDTLRAQAASMDARMAMLAEATKTHVLKHIAQRTDEMTRSAAGQQSRTMEALARTLFETGLRDALLRLGQFIDTRIAQRDLRGSLWTHAATAVVAAAATYVLMIYAASP